MIKKETLLYFIPFIILISFLIGAYSDFTRKVSDEEHDMVQYLAFTESKINEVTNENIIRMIGIATHISTNTDLDAEELDYFIEEIVDIDNSIINNITIFEDTTAVYFYPYEPNVAIKDVDLADIPTQRDDALRVKNLLEIVITPPVELFQGGIGILTRIPITHPDGSYWGQLGYMMRIEDIIESLSLDTDNYTYLITKYDNDANFSHIVYDSGFEDGFLTDEITVNLPSGYWSIQISYSNFFELTSPAFYGMIISAITFSILSVYILFRFKNEKELTQKYLNELILSGNIFENSITHAPVPIMIHTEDGPVLNLSETWTRLTKYKKSDIPTIFEWTKKAYGMNENEVTEFIKKLYKFPEKKHNGEFEVTTKDNEKLIWNFSSGVIGKLPNGKAVAMSVATDVTIEKKRQNEIFYIGYHDALTNLYNRRYYEENLSKLDIPENYPLTIVMSDINGLKLINDAFGHTAGDELLKSAAKVISSSCRETDLIARSGGDEFVIIMPNTSGSEAETIINMINNKAKKIKIESIELSISFGFDTKIDEIKNIQDVYRTAEDLMYREKLIEIPSMRSGAIETILKTLYEKDKNSEIHSRTVSEISERLAVAYGMDRQKVNEVKTAGLLHDIGKIIIPTNIITKEGKLTKKEFDLIKGHSEIGFRILNSTHDMRNISNIVLNHHERWDGLGYPRGKKTNEIPVQSRIIAIADAFDAMTSKRTYREIISNEKALEEIISNAETQFDPELVKVFSDNFKMITESNMGGNE